MSSREVEAQAVLERAKQDALPCFGDYSLRKDKREAQIAIATTLVDNAPATPGEDDVRVFGDLQNGWAVIDLSGTGTATSAESDAGVQPRQQAHEPE